MASSSFDISSALLAALFVLAGWLTNRCTTKPAPPPSTTKTASSDRIIAAQKKVYFIQAVVPLATLLNGLFHAYVAYTFPADLPKLICPNPNNLNPLLFQWNVYTATSLASIIAGGTIRLVAMAQLGNSFTWELAKPVSGLKTNGLHGLMQHPSYTGIILNLPLFLSLIVRTDGVLGCWLPSSIATNQILIAFPATAIVGSMVWAIPARIKDEEEMLHREFGKEWEVYHRNTARFIPGIL
ncbi:MAG: hypothetical protein M4579_006945 [Chaenotheca gracillima]|nr:MAG: hypothetical protein M4579_006945 [Chaenotheca gracillima]